MIILSINILPKHFVFLEACNFLLNHSSFALLFLPLLPSSQYNIFFNIPLRHPLRLSVRSIQILPSSLESALSTVRCPFFFASKCISHRLSAFLNCSYSSPTPLICPLATCLYLSSFPFSKCPLWFFYISNTLSVASSLTSLQSLLGACVLLYYLLSFFILIWHHQVGAVRQTFRCSHQYIHI